MSFRPADTDSCFETSKLIQAEYQSRPISQTPARRARLGDGHSRLIRDAYNLGLPILFDYSPSIFYTLSTLPGHPGDPLAVQILSHPQSQKYNNRVLFGRSRTVSYPTLPTLRTTRFTRSYPLSFTTDPIYTKSKWSTSSPPLSPRSSRCALQLRLSLPTRLARRLLSSVSVRKSTFPSYI